MKKFYLLLLFGLLISAGSNLTYSQTGFNTLIEFCTGTWCQWCPCGDYTIEGILANYPNTMVLAYHGPANQDPYSVFNGNNIIGMMGFNAYPTGVIGRRTGIINWSAWNNPVVIQSNSIQPGVSISFTKNYNSSTKQLQVTADCTSLREIDTACNISFVITEDGLVYNQINNNYCVSGGSNWVHNWVVRNMVNGAAGESISTGTWTANTVKSKSWTTTLDNSWNDMNCNINVFLFLSGNSITSTDFVQQSKIQSVTQPTGISSNNNQIPKNYSLSQNYPNPFNPTTNIHFSIPKDGNVSLKIYDMTGAVVQTYANGFLKAGTYNAEVDASNLASGVYFYTLKAADFMQTKKMILVK